MTPRRYTLGRRAETAAATRDAIVNAAMALYLETGSARVPLKAVAERADVSRGTILHHFGDADGLLDAVIERLLATLVLPDVSVLDGITDPEARVRAFIRELVAFFRRSAPWWRVLQSEAARPAYQAGESEYFGAFARLQAAALGPELSGDPEIQRAIGAVVHPGTVGTMLWVLESGGASAEEATRTVEDLVIGYLRERGVARSPSRRASGSRTM